MTTFNKLLLPHGNYRCSLVARHTIPQPSLEGSRAALELHAVVTDGPHAGHPLMFRVFGEAKMQRARALRKDDPVMATVTQVVLDSGRRVNRVTGFRAENEPSVIQAIEGGQATTYSSGGEAEAGSDTHAADLVSWLRAATHNRSERAGECATERSLIPRVKSETADDFKTAFHWIGSKSGKRSLVEYDRILAQYAACDAAVTTDVPGFVSINQYGSDLAAYAKERDGSLAGYRGRCWSRWLAIDLDGDGTDESLDQILDDTQFIVNALIDLGTPKDVLLAFFSGRRGVHIMWPSGVLAAGPMESFDVAAGLVCRSIASLVGVRVDTAVYKPLAALRAPNTRHEETGLYKIRLPLEDLGALDATAVQQLAQQPRPFVMPHWEVRPVGLLHDLWRLASTVETSTRQRPAAVTSSEQRIFSDTLDLMVHGAPEGSRGMRFFKAAMNLLDFDCPEPLLHALLGPAARLSGYPMNEFTAQIDGAIKAHAGTGAASV